MQLVDNSILKYEKSEAQDSLQDLSSKCLDVALQNKILDTLRKNFQNFPSVIGYDSTRQNILQIKKTFPKYSL